MSPLEPRRLDRANYSTHQSNVLRILSISSCSASLLACLVMYYTYLAIHPRRRKFRHQLIFFLVTFDFLKAIAMIVFPILTYLNPNEVGRKTINFLGFFTALSIEGGDLAILSFAVHTLFTIFWPQRTGGLYFVRYYVYVFSIVAPALLASLGFINGHGYQALDVFCYLPESPIWYRLVLSWCPRFAIMFSILVIYCTIYFYVINQLKKMERNHGLAAPIDNANAWSKLAPTRIIMDRMNRNRVKSPEVKEATRADTAINLELQLDNSQRLRTRYKVIARQMKIIFLYPVAYFILWIFPLTENALGFEGKHVYAITIIVAFVQPFNGVVDTIVWLYREKPWTLTYANTPRSPFTPEEAISKWRQWVQFLPLYKLPQISQDSNEEIVGVLEQKYDLQTNALMASINPEEFLLTDHANKTSFENTGESTTTTAGSYKRNFSVVSSHDEDEMDLLDFLNNGPPT